MNKSEELLLALSYKYKGNWDEIYRALHYRVDGDYDDLDIYLEQAKAMKCKYTTILSDDYPQSLKRCTPWPPFVLYYYGDLSLVNDESKLISVVGSRDCSEYGGEMTQKIVKEICHEFTIVSGMALGIDAIAHQTAIDNGGKTVAVLGGGIDYVYPYSNRFLYEELKNHHLIISEHPGDTMPEQKSFPMRNRIIAFLSRGTIVTEAYAKSGTLTTVKYALDNNKLIFCVPYLATSKSECNRLIDSGAYLVESGNDVIEIVKNLRSIW